MLLSQHYEFVFNVFKQLFFESTEDLIDKLFKSGQPHGVNVMWGLFGDTYKLVSPNAKIISPKDISYTSFEIENNINAYIITLPKPAMPPEAYFIGLIHRSPDDAAGVEGVKRYITLESSLNLFSKDNSYATQFCEILPEGRKNFGLSLAPDLETFGNALISLVKESQKFEPLISSGM